MEKNKMDALRSVKDGICAEILDIMDTYDEQVAKNGYPDTPGGLEHMGDVWRLLDRWRDSIKAASPIRYRIPRHTRG